MKKLVFILIFCLTYAININCQVAGSGKASVHINNKPIPVVNQQKAPLIEQNNYVQPVASTRLPVGAGKYYALVIGINDYLDPQINSLDYCVRDAGVFYNTLTSKYTFEKENVRFLENATMAQIVSALDYFAKSVRPIDNFLIFYAGHGVWDTSSEIGFWLPSDARQNSKLAWFRNSTLRDYLREINSKHTLLITDACFGGSIFKSRAAFMDATLAVNKLYELPSRKAMTSGTLTEVPDQSAFLKYMIDRLDNNSEKYLSSEQLFSSFRIAVINNSNVIPQFGEIKDVGDEGGDFIFILKE
jgi:Caspase domain